MHIFTSKDVFIIHLKNKVLFQTYNEVIKIRHTSTEAQRKCLIVYIRKTFFQPKMYTYTDYGILDKREEILLYYYKFYEILQTRHV